MVKEVGRKVIAQNKKARHKLSARMKEGGLTLVPLSLYFKDGKAKIELAVAKGKKVYDKRAALMERQAGREIEREVSRRRSGKDS